MTTPSRLGRKAFLDPVYIIKSWVSTVNDRVLNYYFIFIIYDSYFLLIAVANHQLVWYSYQRKGSELEGGAMNTFQLSCFLTVANTLNFAQAAKQVNISQPAITGQIKSLEKELDTKLFHRTTRMV